MKVFEFFSSSVDTTRQLVQESEVLNWVNGYKSYWELEELIIPNFTMNAKMVSTSVTAVASAAAASAVAAPADPPAESILEAARLELFRIHEMTKLKSIKINYPLNLTDL